MFYEKYKGFTLIESIIAISLIVTLAIPLFSFFSWGIRSERVSEGKMGAMYLAQEKMEEQIANGYDKACSGEVKGVANGSISYDVVTDVSQLPQKPEMKKVRVSVSWEEFGKTKNMSLVTFLTKI